MRRAAKIGRKRRRRTRWKDRPGGKCGPVTTTHTDGTVTVQRALTGWEMATQIEGRRPISPALRDRILRRDHGRCRYCRTDQGPFEMDHVVPVVLGGTTSYRNLVTACSPCNRRKADSVWTPLPITA